MKWFKHMSGSSEDEGIVKLESVLGLEGYARWFKLLEIVARHMDETDRCCAEYPWEKWQQLLKAKRKVLVRFLEHSGNILGIFWESDGFILKITVPNMMKYRDNYTNNLQATNKQEVDVDVDNKKKKKTPPDGGDKSPTFWDVGKGMGIPGAVIGKQIKSVGEPKVAEVIAEMSVKKPADPTTYLIGATTKKKRRTAV